MISLSSSRHYTEYTHTHAVCEVRGRSSLRFILRASTSEKEMKQLLLRAHPFSRKDVQRSSATDKSIICRGKAAMDFAQKEKLQ